jgi:hypothetical protein
MKIQKLLWVIVKVVERKTLNELQDARKEALHAIRLARKLNEKFPIFKQYIYDLTLSQVKFRVLEEGDDCQPMDACWSGDPVESVRQ